MGALLSSCLPFNADDALPAQARPREGADSEEFEALVNGKIYVLSKPSNNQVPDVDIVFIHGLQLGDYTNAYKETWRSTTRSGEKVYWPCQWLGQDFPNARILTVSYDCGARGDKQRVFMMVEGILDNLIKFAEIGKGRPVVFVGHSLGGLMIKELCLKVQQKAGEEPYKSLVQSIKGVFFYATPHHGSTYADLVNKLKIFFKPSYYLEYLGFAYLENVINNNNLFDSACNQYKWETFALAETAKIKPLRDLVVSYDSAMLRGGVAVQGADHISICKPKDKKDESYLYLFTFIHKLTTKDMEASMVSLHKLVEDIKNQGRNIMEALYYINNEVVSDKVPKSNEIAKQLVQREVILYLVQVIKKNEKAIHLQDEMLEQVGWALDNILEQAGQEDKAAFQKAVDAGAVEALVSLLHNDTTAVSAMYCLRNLTGNSDPACVALQNHEQALQHAGAQSTKTALHRLRSSSPEAAADVAAAILKTMHWPS